MIHNTQGVPQGSVLGPLLYTLLINQLPEVVKEDDCEEMMHDPQDNLFGTNCEKCGTVPCYADDASVIHASTNRTKNQDKLRQHLESINVFLNRNGLNINREKTTINEIVTRQKRATLIGDSPVLEVLDKNGRDKTIKANSYTRLLGGNVSSDLSWKAHLLSGEKTLVPQLRQQLGALKILAKVLPRKSRLLLANGFIISKASYLIQLWGGAYKSDIRKVQTIINQAARFVTNLNKRTRTIKLMDKCRWLTVSELIHFQSLASMWLIVNKKIPQHLAEHLALSEDLTLHTKSARLKIVRNNFKHRTLRQWNLLPKHIRCIGTISCFNFFSSRLG